LEAPVALEARAYAGDARIHALADPGDRLMMALPKGLAGVESQDGEPHHQAAGLLHRVFLSAADVSPAASRNLRIGATRTCGLRRLLTGGTGPPFSPPPGPPPPSFRSI